MTSKGIQFIEKGTGTNNNGVKKQETTKIDTNKIKIIDVWKHNLNDEMENISNILNEYNFISMDTEFPGVVARPTGSFNTSKEYHYQTLMCNVNLLKIIQLGLTFSNSKGTLPKDGKCCWQFNFKFSLKEDMYAQDSIDLLTNSGIDFDKLEKDGIDVEEFGEILTTSGIVLNTDVRWVAFHSGYDFGYLLKILTNNPLPNKENEFFELLHTYFPFVYDIKYLMKSCERLKGGLNQVAEDLQITRVGPAHQAGSDSLLTCFTFFKMMSTFFENKIDEQKNIGIVYGLGSTGGERDGYTSDQTKIEIDESELLQDTFN